MRLLFLLGFMTFTATVTPVALVLDEGRIMCITRKDAENYLLFTAQGMDDFAAQLFHSAACYKTKDETKAIVLEGDDDKELAKVRTQQGFQLWLVQNKK